MVGVIVRPEILLFDWVLLFLTLKRLYFKGIVSVAMNFGIFAVMKAGDLVNCNFQFYVCHKSIDDFKIGDKVHLKSSPEVPMTVIGFRKNKFVDCRFMSRYKPRTFCFIPETIIQYDQAFRYSLT